MIKKRVEWLENLISVKKKSNKKNIKTNYKNIINRKTWANRMQSIRSNVTQILYKIGLAKKTLMTRWTIKFDLLDCKN